MVRIRRRVQEAVRRGHPKIQNERRQQVEAGGEHNPQRKEAVFDYVVRVARVAPCVIIGNLPDSVQVVPEFVECRGGAEEQGEQTKHRGRNSMLGPVRAFYYGLNQSGAFGAHHPLHLPDQASLRGFGAECKTCDGKHDHQAGGEREGHVVGQGSPHSRCAIAVPVTNRDTQERPDFFEGNGGHRLHGVAPCL